jgi:hypothetical protein
MRGRPVRLIIIFLALAIDFGLLAFVSFYLFHTPSGPSAQASLTPTSVAAGASGKAVPAAALPQMTAAIAGARTTLSGGPRFILCGTVDSQGTAWVGTEGQGLWTCSHQHWTKISDGQNLPEDGITAVACDAVGRVWVGTNSHGVSVFNGKAWANYDRFHGPGGSHIFALATSPVEGDVWLSTENGLARYSLKDDAWSWIDRSNGLPAVGCGAMAISPAGDVIVALPDAGVAVARAKENFANWTSTTGPDTVPSDGAGAGLPSPVVLALLWTHDGTVYAGTNRGLARSTDQGVTWSYVQGANWPLLAHGSYANAGSADADKPVPSDNTAPLLEDWVTALAEDAGGSIWIGYRSQGYQVVSPAGSFSEKLKRTRVIAVLPVSSQSALVCSHRDGTTWVGNTDGTVALPPRRAAQSALSLDQFPTPPKTPSADVLDALRAKVEALPDAPEGAEYLGDDWETSGDWTGRFGTAMAQLGWPNFAHQSAGYGIESTTGPYRQSPNFYYYESVQEKLGGHPERGLFFIAGARRSYCELNDGAFDGKGARTWQEGPDQFVRFSVPSGVYRIALYFCDYEGHQNADDCRAMTLQLRKVEAAGSEAPASPTPGGAGSQTPAILEEHINFGGNGSPGLHRAAADAEVAPILGRSYVSYHWFGVYKQFLVRGGGEYWIKIGRNYAAPCKFNGAFIDRLDQPAAVIFEGGIAWPAPVKVPDLSNGDPTVQAAVKLWAALDHAVGKAGYAAINAGARTLAYRAAAGESAAPELLANWRFAMHAWTQADRDQFAAYMKQVKPTEGN